MNWKRAALSTSVSLFIAILIGTAALEWLVRRSRFVTDPSQADPSLGVPRTWVRQKLAQLKDAGPRVVFIGDSFVETGEVEGGWLSQLGTRGSGLGARHSGVFALGFAGAAPSQYLELYKAARSQGYTGAVVIVLYLGNDLEDELVWQMTADKTRYMERRREHFGNPSSPLFWPCYEETADRRSAVRKRLSLYKNLIVTTGGAIAAKSSGADTWTAMEQLQAKRCSRPPFAETVNGRVFFFRHHEAILARPESKPSWQPLLALLHTFAADPKVSFAVAFSREENCRDVHGRQVSSAAPLVDWMRSRGMRVADPNEAFRAACRQSYPYLPDGHWNHTGHELFAAGLSQAVPQ